LAAGVEDLLFGGEFSRGDAALALDAGDVVVISSR